jgi:alkaline phosphatase D
MASTAVVSTMSAITRRELLATAIALGATCGFAAGPAAASTRRWSESRALYPEGVASGEPTSDSVILWTRRPPAPSERRAPQLTVEVAEDDLFRRVIATINVTPRAEADWTTRVLVGGLQPAREYWYRFVEASGQGSRVGRTITGPTPEDPRSVCFAFVSCQNATQGAQNAYRRMIFEDERAAPTERLGFVLHLGDFIYEIVWYPEDRPQGMYDRTLADLIRYPHGERIQDFHIPTTVEDYRLAYRQYLHDPDLQDARARWPFVNMWDNHEFSWLGWQSLQRFNDVNRPAQTRKVAAYQAWFEYQPARVRRPGQESLAVFRSPKVVDHAIAHFDENGLGQEQNNLTALQSMLGYRVVRWGKNVDLIITDQRGFRSEDPLERSEAKAFSSAAFPEFIPEQAVAIVDAGRAYRNGNPPDSIALPGRQVPNYRKNEPAQTILGAEQRAWFFGQLKDSTATWKIWGNTIATLDPRADLQNLSSGGPAWGAGYASMAMGDFGNALHERGQIYDFVRTNGIGGFVTVSGDRHSFWAGLAAKSLPPERFDPVGLAFVVGSISAPGVIEALEHRLPKDHPLRRLYLLDDAGGAPPAPTINLLMLHGVRACEEFARTRNAAAARRLSNPELAPHLAFLDWGGHGYAIVRAAPEAIETEFVCIPRPIRRAAEANGGPLRYRVIHSARLWSAGEAPQLTQRVVEGDPGLSI